MDKETQVKIMQINLPEASQNIFAHPPTRTQQVAQETQDVMWVDRTEYPPNGGIYVYKFGADILPIPAISEDEMAEYKKKGEEILVNLKKLLGEDFILLPNGKEVNLVPTKIFESQQAKPDPNTRINALYPEKGFPDPERIWACNLAKRFFITQLKFFSESKILFFPTVKMLERWLKEFNEFCFTAISTAYLKDDRYCVFCRELKIFIKEFLKGIGIEDIVADNFARDMATLIEYDTAYRYRSEDILSETTPQKLKTAPRREIRRLLRIFATRENRPHLIKKFDLVGYAISLMLLFPKIKKAFMRALDKIDFTKLQYDDADRYYCLRMHGYEFMGRPIQDRMNEYANMHGGNMPKSISIHAE